MKICFLTNDLSGRDGWSRYSVSLINQLHKKGIECSVLVSGKAGSSILPDVKDFRVLPNFGSRIGKVVSLIFNFFKIRRLINDCDMVHVLVEPYTLIPFLLRVKKPVFVTLHGTYAVTPFKKWYLKKLYSKAYRKVKKIFCVSKFTQLEFLKNIKVDNTLVINNGIDFDKFQTLKPDHIEENGKTIIGVGALKSRKGYHISIPAVANLKEKYPDFKYFIVGFQDNKEYFNHLKHLVKKHGLESNIIFMEGISDKKLVSLYYHSDLFLLTPVNVNDAVEGFGLVYLEANACGLPVVGTRNCGAEEAIKDGVTGMLVSQDNILETSQAIMKILDNDKLSGELGEKGYQFAQSMNWSKVINKYIGVYKDL